MAKKKDFKVSTFEARALTWWLARRNKLDMDPPYQRRGRLWSKADKAYLIDSILNEYDVPKFYIADFTWGNSPLNEKNLPYAIIDGKQRFEAIFDFYDSNIVLNEDFIFLEQPQLKLGGLGYKDLKENYFEVAELFDNYNLSVMSVLATSEAPITELFVRLNRSKSLTGAEVRKAMAGPAPRVIRELAQHEFFQTNIRFAVSRGQDLNAAAKVLLFEFGRSLKETKKRNLDVFVSSFEDMGNVELELAGRRVLDTLDDMSAIFLPRDSVLASAGVFPVYYWLTREIDEKKYSHLREFLIGIERARSETRRLSKEKPDRAHIDSELLEFDRFNRSTNDLQSHTGRFKILKDRFRRKYGGIKRKKYKKN